MRTPIWVLLPLALCAACGGENVTFSNDPTSSSSSGDPQGGSGGGGAPPVEDGGGGSEETGGGSSGGMGGQGGDPMVCTPGASQCSGLDVETCNSEGSAWEVTQTCPFICDQGACGGVCAPNDQKCDGQTPQTCDSNGQWSNGTDCEFVCTAGTCTGSCTPATVQCNGNTVQTCNGMGTWDNTLVCPYVCSGGACGGVCVPGNTQCDGNTVETCDGAGMWQSGAPCPFVCQAGACSGVCIPGTVECDGSGTKTCNVNGQWAATVPCPGDVNADPTCSAGICGTTCQTGFEDCTGAPGCESDLSDPATCGSCNNTCNSTGGTPTCSMGMCGIICDSTHEDCANGASDGCETTLGTLTDCSTCNDACNSPPANAVGVCDGVQQGCGYACLSGWDDCENGATDGCEHDVTGDPWNCGGCGISCHGGSCVAGVCEWPIDKVADATDVTSLAVGSQEVYWTEADGDIQKALSTGGPAVLLASGQNDPQAAVTDGTKVIWSNTTSPKKIQAVPVGGGSVQTLVSGHGPLELTHDGVELFWTDATTYTPCLCSTYSETNIWRAPIAGGTPTVANSTMSPPGSRAWPSWPGVVVDSGHIYRIFWASTSAAGNVQWLDKTNPLLFGNWSSAWTGGPSHLAISPNGEKLAYFNGWHIQALDSRQLMGSSNEVQVVSAPGLVSLAIDDTYAYYIVKPNGVSWSTIYKAPLVGGPGTIIANFQFAADHIHVDGSHVYWVTEGYKFANPNPSTPDVPDPVVLRVAK